MAALGNTALKTISKCSFTAVSYTHLDVYKRQFNAIELGFNSMVGELKNLVGNAQRSAVQMTTSVLSLIHIWSSAA